MNAKQWIFGTLATSNNRGYHCISKSNTLTSTVCSGLEQYCLSFGENNLKEDFSSFSIQYFDKTVALIRHFSSNEIDHAGRQGGVIHHALVFDYTPDIDFSKFLVKDNFKTTSLIKENVLSEINIKKLKVLNNYFGINIGIWYNLFKPMSEVNINVIRKNQFNHCWCVALKKEEALMVGRILYNVFRLESIKISFCDNVLNPGTRVNFRIIAHPKVKKKVEKIIIDKNPKLKAKPHLTYHSIYKTLAKEENIIDKFRNLFGS